MIRAYAITKMFQALANSLNAANTVHSEKTYLVLAKSEGSHIFEDGYAFNP